MDSLQSGVIGYREKHQIESSKKELIDLFNNLPDFFSIVHIDIRSLHCLSQTSKKYSHSIRNPFFSAHKWIFQSPFVKTNEQVEEIKLIDFSSSIPTILERNYSAVIKRYFDKNYLESISKCLSDPSSSRDQWIETILSCLPLAVNQTKHPGLLRSLYDFFKKYNHNPETQSQVFEFVKASTRDQNSEMKEIAIKCVLNAYCDGYFGLNYEDLNIQAEGLKLAEGYAIEGSEAAIDYLLNVRNENPNQVKKRNFEYYKKFAKQKNERSITSLLVIYQGGILFKGKFSPIADTLIDTQDPKIQEEGLKLAKTFASEGSPNALKFLLNAHQYGLFGLNASDPQVQKEGLELAKDYANRGSEAAIEYLLASYNKGYFGLNAQNPQIQKEGWELAKAYANKGSEAAIEYLLEKCKHSQDLGLQKEGLKLLEKYADEQSETAFKFISQLSYPSFGLSSDEAKNLKQKLLNDHAKKQSEKALYYLLEEHKNFAPSAYLAQPYANKNSKTALNFLSDIIG